MLAINQLTDEELGGLSVETLSDLLWGAVYSGTTEDCRRLHRILERKLKRFPVLNPSRQWNTTFDPDQWFGPE